MEAAWLLPLTLHLGMGSPKNRVAPPNAALLHSLDDSAPSWAVWPPRKDRAAGPGHPMDISQPTAAGRCLPKMSICCSTLRTRPVLLERVHEAEQEVTDGPLWLGH